MSIESPRVRPVNKEQLTLYRSQKQTQTANHQRNKNIRTHNKDLPSNKVTVVSGQ